ncbi:uncharacterized protein JNUCC1_03803 [Lentibacillus sp. JNUCC-1]|uniref:DUF503 domain-containing protein n=1 Tax=Lentibacillus sp. JNUCC-1 TaxID=2654513 RepID=UPI0012E894F5|nr:DUF503 domain-containing protein [Lentibacillus sp. JNUCC-1]MUV39919.1 uncharacterized protein [Lentibacillus sp. JNUCC-1]
MILLMEVECFLYNTHSLKGKRSVLKSLITRLRQDFNVSVAELDYHDLWQRTKLGIVTISNDLRLAEKIMQEVQAVIDADTEMECTHSVTERL